ncbi:molybdate ABC transporter substrate-binding protein [Reyranella sp.]|uniref:molybdate ABC transporter substrate-binding protein n=1 Tax=Reyranella sp. TaxID=1929291 RepID=UPI003BABC3F0
MRLLFAALLAVAGFAGGAAAADLKILSAGAYKAAAQEIAAAWTKTSGHTVTIENDTAGNLARRVAAGEYFDIVVLPPLVMGPYLGSRLDESSAKELARVGIGVAVKKGAAKPDISTVDSWKQALLGARAIAYIDPAAGGSSGIYLSKLFEKMGIAAALKPKSVLVKGGLVAEKVVNGEAEIAMQQMSELLAVPGAEVVGPLPLDVQHFTIYSGAISVATRNRVAADQLMLALANPGNLKILKSKGLDGP